MINESNIPVLTDVIEKNDEIELADLGLGKEFTPGEAISQSRSKPAMTGIVTPALEQEIRRILDEHLELAWQEIRRAIHQSSSGTDSES